MRREHLRRGYMFRIGFWLYLARLVFSSALLLGAMTGNALAQAKVRYSLAAYQTGTVNKLTTIKAGADLDLALLVQDLRPEGEYTLDDGSSKPLLRGVFAAFADIYCRKDCFDVHLPPTFKEPYKNFDPTRCNKLAPWGIASLGAFDGFAVIGSDMKEVCRVKLTAKWPATMPLSFTSTDIPIRPDFSKLPHPWCDTLVLGNFAAQPAEQSDVKLTEIIASGVSITIQK